MSNIDDEVHAYIQRLCKGPTKTSAIHNAVASTFAPIDANDVAKSALGDQLVDEIVNKLDLEMREINKKLGHPTGEDVPKLIERRDAILRTMSITFPKR